MIFRYFFKTVYENIPYAVFPDNYDIGAKASNGPMVLRVQMVLKEGGDHFPLRSSRLFDSLSQKRESRTMNK